MEINHQSENQYSKEYLQVSVDSMNPSGISCVRVAVILLSYDVEETGPNKAKLGQDEGRDVLKYWSKVLYDSSQQKAESKQNERDDVINILGDIPIWL